MRDTRSNPTRKAARAACWSFVLACCCAIATAQSETPVTLPEDSTTPQEERAAPQAQPEQPAPPMEPTTQPVSEDPTLSRKPRAAQPKELDPKLQNLLRERDRDQMHEGDPLALVGQEQGENNLRSRTPALVNSDRKQRLLDSVEMHERALAMYDKDAHFSQPPAAAVDPNAKPKKSRSKWIIGGADTAAQSTVRSRIAMLGALLASLIGIGVLLQRHLKSLRATDASIV